MIGFATFGLVLILIGCWLCQPIGKVKVIESYQPGKPSEVVRVVVLPPMRWQAIWKAATPYLIFGLVLAVGFIVGKGMT